MREGNPLRANSWRESLPKIECRGRRLRHNGRRVAHPGHLLATSWGDDAAVTATAAGGELEHGGGRHGRRGCPMPCSRGLDRGHIFGGGAIWQRDVGLAVGIHIDPRHIAPAG